MSSTGLEKSIYMTGVFDTDPRRNPLWGANKAYVAYCSSDAWAGDAGPDGNPMGWQFRGQRIVNATFRTLAEQHGFGAMPHTRVIFGGCSAGSRGAMFNLDVVANTVVPKGVQVLGFLDSPLWVDVQPFDSTVMPLENETQLIVPLINPTNVLDPNCVAVYPGSEMWKCMYGEWRLPFLKTPFLVSASQFDKYQLSYNENTAPPYTGDALTYANSFQSTVRNVLAGIPTAKQPYSAVFSTACFKHCTSDIGDFWGVKIGRINLKTWLDAWLLGSLPQSKLVESCVGFGCGQCHAKPGPDALTLAQLYSPPPPSPSPPMPPRPLLFGRFKAPRQSSATTLTTAAVASPPATVKSRAKQMSRTIAIAVVLLAVFGFCLTYATRVVRRPPSIADDLERRRLLTPANAAKRRSGLESARPGQWIAATRGTGGSDL